MEGRAHGRCRLSPGPLSRGPDLRVAQLGRQRAGPACARVPGRPRLRLGVPRRLAHRRAGPRRRLARPAVHQPRPQRRPRLRRYAGRERLAVVPLRAGPGPLAAQADPVAAVRRRGPARAGRRHPGHQPGLGRPRPPTSSVPGWSLSVWSRPSAGMPRRSPFPGLRPFDESYAPVFFGRERQVDQLRQLVDPPSRARQGVVVPVLGPVRQRQVVPGPRGTRRRAATRSRLGRLRPVDARRTRRWPSSSLALAHAAKRHEVALDADECRDLLTTPGGMTEYLRRLREGRRRTRGRAGARRRRPGRGAGHADAPSRSGQAFLEALALSCTPPSPLRVVMTARTDMWDSVSALTNRFETDRGDGGAARTTALACRPGARHRRARQALPPRPRGRPAAAPGRGHRERRRAATARLHAPADDGAGHGRPAHPRAVRRRRRRPRRHRVASGRGRTAARGRRPRSPRRSCTSSAPARAARSPAWPASTRCRRRSARSSTTSSTRVSS